MGKDRPRIEATHDWVRTYTAAEENRLTENLAQLQRDIVDGGYSSHSMSLDLLRDIHSRLFNGVRDHAGQIRRPGWGQQYLRFGPNRSEDRDRVPALLDQLCRKLRRRLDEVDRDDPLAVVQLAVEAHAEVVRIHPFEDGSGRTSRALLDIIMVRCGWPPIPLEVPKGEYNECLNRYHASGDSDLIVDLYLGLLRNLLEGAPE